ncbi:hypothetical protein TcWFU_008471 [Taenia crassiceps]|uniref:Uncharacterized protein n=1 Tax=Taenia crassiceps TaxID=6207 RepID=A0ABR4QSZ8_9CEST
MLFIKAASSNVTAVSFEATISANFAHFLQDKKASLLLRQLRALFKIFPRKRLPALVLCVSKCTVLIEKTCSQQSVCSKSSFPKTLHSSANNKGKERASFKMSLDVWTMLIPRLTSILKYFGDSGRYIHSECQSLTKEKHTLLRGGSSTTPKGWTKIAISLGNFANPPFCRQAVHTIRIPTELKVFHSFRISLQGELVALRAATLVEKGRPSIVTLMYGEKAPQLFWRPN